MARRIDGWTDQAATLAAATPAGPALQADGSASVADSAERLTMAEHATCDCPDFRRDKVCDHVLMAAAVRMVRRMIDAQKSH